MKGKVLRHHPVLRPLRKHAPGGSGHFICQGDARPVVPSSVYKSSLPVCSYTVPKGRTASLHGPQHRSCPMNEQRAGITVTTFGDSKETLLSPSGVLPRNQAEIGRELSPVLEISDRPSHSQQNGRSKDADSRNLHEPFAGLVRLGNFLQCLVLLDDFGIERGDVFVNRGEKPSHGARKTVVLVAHDGRQVTAYMAGPLSDDDAILGEQSPSLVDRCRSGLDKTPAHPVDGLDVRLFLGPARHETHMRSTHRLADSCRVVGIVFVRHEVGFNEFGVDAAGRVATFLNDPRPVGRTGACLHADQARRQVGEEGCDLVASEHPAQNDPPLGIDAVELKGVLCQVNTNDGNPFHGMASFKDGAGASSLPRLEGWGHPITAKTGLF